MLSFQSSQSTDKTSPAMEKNETASNEHEHALSKGVEMVGVDDYVRDSDEEKKLVRKIDLYLLPLIFIMVRNLIRITLFQASF